MSNLNFNKVILGGRLTADPELKTTASGIAVTSFSIAVNRRPAKGADGQASQQSDFFNCAAWRSTAEFITRYFKKGSSICIVGTLQNRTWNDPQGNKRYATDIVVDEVHFVDSKGDSEPKSESVAPEYYNTTGVAFEAIEPDQDLPFN